MAGKSGGRLTFSGRQEYQVAPVVGNLPPPMVDKTSGLTGVIGYAAVCFCALGTHYLAPFGEYVEQPGKPAYVYPTYAEAQAAIEQWQRQHAAAQANSGESEE